MSGYGKLAYIDLTEDGKAIEIAVEKDGKLVKVMQDFGQSGETVSRLMRARERLPEILQLAEAKQRPEIVPGRQYTAIPDPFWNIGSATNAVLGGVDMWTYVAGYDWVVLQIPQAEAVKLASFVAQYSTAPSHGQQPAEKPGDGEPEAAKEAAAESQPTPKTLH